METSHTRETKGQPVGDHKTARNSQDSKTNMKQKGSTKEALPLNRQLENYWRAKTCLMVPTPPLFLMWIKNAHGCLPVWLA